MLRTVFLVPSRLPVLFGAAFALALAPTAPLHACEPIHDLITFGEPVGDEVIFQCVSGQTVCPADPQGNPLGPCLACGSGEDQKLCWASECRGFNGDTGQYGQFKKDAPGELEAIVMEILNHDTGQTVVLVDKVATPDCPIPAATATGTCTSLYKVKSVRPIGEGTGPLCTWDNLDDVNTIVRTPLSQGVVLIDVNGKQCSARKRAGDQWWMFYQDCCSPVSEFGAPGESLSTKMTLIIENGGACQTNTVRPDSTDLELVPDSVTPPCL